MQRCSEVTPGAARLHDLQKVNTGTMGLQSLKAVAEAETA